MMPPQGDGHDVAKRMLTGCSYPKGIQEQPQRGLRRPASICLGQTDGGHGWPGHEYTFCLGYGFSSRLTSRMAYPSDLAQVINSFEQSTLRQRSTCQPLSADRLARYHLLDTNVLRAGRSTWRSRAQNGDCRYKGVSMGDSPSRQINPLQLMYEDNERFIFHDVRPANVKFNIAPKNTGQSTDVHATCPLNRSTRAGFNRGTSTMPWFWNR